MATAAVEAPSLVGRVLALLLRPFFVFFDVTLLGYLFLRLSDRDPSIPAYFDWLQDLFPLDEPASAGLEHTLQLVVAATVVAAVIAAIVAGLVRRVGGGQALIGWSIPLLSLAGPMLALTLLYWLAVRTSALPAFGATSVVDDPAEALRQLALPALAVGLPMAAPLATIAIRTGPYDPYTEPYGMAAAGSLLASRAEARDGWRFGFPAGLLFAGTIVAELVFSRPGLARLAIEGIVVADHEVALDALGLLALGGAALALVVDLIGLRPTTVAVPTLAGLRLAGRATKRPSRLLLGLAGGLGAVMLAVAGWGSVTADPELDVQATQLGPFSEGHVLGTDQLGRDLLSLAAVGSAEPLIVALVASGLALVAAIVLMALQRSLGIVGEIIPGTVVDGLWWPVPLLLIFAAAAASAGPSLTDPVVLTMLSLGLVPTALRLVRREPIDFDAGGWLRLAGHWLLLAPVAYLAHLIAAFAGFDERVRPALGVQLGTGRESLASTVWPSLVPSAFAALTLLAFYGLGASLVHFGWDRTARRVTSEPDEHPVEAPVRQPGQPILHGEPAPVFPPVAPEPLWDDGSPLAPNYHLQPGLPQVDPNDDSIDLDELPTIPPPPVTEDEHA